MASSAVRIVDRLRLMGITFPKGEPTRAHYKCRGQVPNTWLVRETDWGGPSFLCDRVPWQTPQRRPTDAYSSGHEIILDLPARELARTPCLVAYYYDRDRWDMCLTTLDGYARAQQLLLGPRALAWHWLDRDPYNPAGRECLVGLGRDRVRATIVEGRYYTTNLVTDFDPSVDVSKPIPIPQVGVRIQRNDDNEITWLRHNDVELRDDICETWGGVGQ